MNIMNNMCIGNCKCWFFDETKKSLYSVDLKTGKIKFEAILNLFRSKNYDYYFIDMVYSDGKVIMIPGREEDIYIFDTEKKLWSKIEIKKQYKKIYKSISGFVNGIVSNKNLYLIPYTYPDCIRINLDNMLVEYIPFENHFGCTIGLYSRGIKINEHEILLLSRENNGVEIYNVDTNKFQTFHIGDNNVYYLDACFNKNMCYLVDNNENIIEWNRVTGETNKIFDCTVNNIKTLNNRVAVNECRIKFFDNNIWFFDCDYMPIKLELRSGKWSIIDNLIFENYDNGKYYITYADLVENKFVLYIKCIESVVIYNPVYNDKICIPLKNTKELDNSLLRGYIKFIYNGGLPI